MTSVERIHISLRRADEETRLGRATQHWNKIKKGRLLPGTPLKHFIASIQMELPVLCRCLDRGYTECRCEPEKEIKQRGRPKNEDAELRTLDVRLTPGDQTKRPDFVGHFRFTDFPKMLVCEEGGVGTDTKLHYHCYLETKRSDTYLYKLFSTICGGKGNKYYSIRAAHEGTQGYAVKDELIVYHIGFTDQEITDLVTKSREYRKENETDRKRNSRQKEKYLASIVKEVAEGVSIHPNPTPEYIITEILKCYDRDQKRFPNRSVLENIVLTLLYKNDPHFVLRYYTKNFC